MGIFARNREDYEFLKRILTAERVKRHFAKICKGEVERYAAENLLALNFVLHDSLGGGGSASLKTDAQGKTHGMALLRIEVEVPDDYEPPRVGSRGALAPNSDLRRPGA